MPRHILTAPFDAATELKDSGAALTANAAGTVGGQARVINVGSAFMAGAWIVDVDSLDLASADESYTIELQGADDAAFTAGVVVLGSIRFGKASAINETADRGVGRQQKEFFNAVDGISPKPYLRAFLRVAGTTPSIQYRSFLTKSPLHA